MWHVHICATKSHNESTIDKFKQQDRLFRIARYRRFMFGADVKLVLIVAVMFGMIEG